MPKQELTVLTAEDAEVLIDQFELDDLEPDSESEERELLEAQNPEYLAVVDKLFAIAEGR